MLRSKLFCRDESLVFCPQGFAVVRFCNRRMRDDSYAPIRYKCIIHPPLERWFVWHLYKIIVLLDLRNIPKIGVILFIK